jgi:hypothetical protein
VSCSSGRFQAISQRRVGSRFVRDLGNFVLILFLSAFLLCAIRRRRQPAVFRLESNWPLRRHCSAVRSIPYHSPQSTEAFANEKVPAVIMVFCAAAWCSVFGSDGLNWNSNRSDIGESVALALLDLRLGAWRMYPMLGGRVQRVVPCVVRTAARVVSATRSEHRGRHAGLVLSEAWCAIPITPGVPTICQRHSARPDRC